MYTNMPVPVRDAASTNLKTNPKIILAKDGLLNINRSNYSGGPQNQKARSKLRRDDHAAGQVCVALVGYIRCTSDSESPGPR